MIMLGSARDDEFGGLVKTAREAGANTQSAYIVWKRSTNITKRPGPTGAEIVMEIADQDFGGRLYSAVDPEGYLWNFGSYDPWPELRLNAAG